MLSVLRLAVLVSAMLQLLTSHALQRAAANTHRTLQNFHLYGAKSDAIRRFFGGGGGGEKQNVPPKTTAAAAEQHEVVDPSVSSVEVEYFNRPGAWDEKNLESLLRANKAWANRMVAEKPDFFGEHRKGHAPKILWIGCSDARVPANEMIGEPPGSVFVHRNVANMVVNTDFNCMSVIQYAVDVLQVKHIIVCGHYDCGGVKAALQNSDHRSPLENWLRNIRDTYRLHKEELNAISDLRMRQRRLVELNVIEQCLNIFKTAVVQRRRVETHLESKKPGSLVKFSQPVVHAFVYEPTTGMAAKLRVDFRKYLEKFGDVYGLYQVPPSMQLVKPSEVAPDAPLGQLQSVLSESLEDEFINEDGQGGDEETDFFVSSKVF